MVFERTWVKWLERFDFLKWQKNWSFDLNDVGEETLVETRIADSFIMEFG